MDGVLILNKPAQWTSHDVVAKVRGLLKEKQIGHLGTLDPLATGVLPLALGAATRLIEFASHDKEYIATCLLGKTTDSEDVTGRLLSETSTAQLDPGDVRQETLNLRTLTEQIPPMVSAIKKDGQKLYELARAGKTVERKPRPIQIREIEILEVELPRAQFRVACSGGTYIRSLCRELGERLGVGGCLEKLERTQSGSFLLKNSISIEELKKRIEEGNLSGLLRPSQSLVEQMPAITLSPGSLEGFCRGRAVPAPGIEPGFFRVLNLSGRMTGIGEADESTPPETLKPKKVFGLDGID
jgi:tRNA pseudouridine55 synthase